MKIGLALSGGGVLGVAHLGVLEEITKRGIKIDMIAGTSSGAIIGALFAAGGMNKVKDFLDDLAAIGLFDSAKLIWQLNADKMFDQIKSTLIKNLDAEVFSDLPIKFVCNATDLTHGTVKYFRHGGLADCVMASAAYPGVFKPQTVNGEYYIDGGITKNFPAEILHERGMDFVIGSSLYNIAKFEKFNNDGKIIANRVDIAVRSLDIIQKRIADIDMKKCDFCFSPPVESYRWFNFNRIKEIRAVGEEHAQQNIPALVKLLKQNKKSTFWKDMF